MNDKLYVLPSGGGITIGDNAADKLLASGSGNAALVYIYILKNRGSIALKEAAGATGLSADEVESAMETLSRLGLVTAAVSASSKRGSDTRDESDFHMEKRAPQNTGGDRALDLHDAPEKGVLLKTDFRQLVGEAQRKLGKVLSSADLTILLGLYDYLGLPTEVIGLILTHCVAECRRRYGDGRMPTMRQIEKEAYIWSEKGIDTVEQATEYLRRISVLSTKSGQAAKALQISGRALTASEQNYISQWLEMGFGTAEIELAYDRTVLNTGSLKWGYLNSILKKWHEKNLHTVEEIKSGDRKTPSARQSAGKPGASEKSAIEMMKQYMEKKE